ncbi:hypothetical protein TorRG33x02_136870 [Trema orientale]|uniref:Pollen Ole e 1 allergen and extensin family protein n=1 Tax=Trema orientale TaxID=63057 RepID=A0A2P5EXY9_TREOI|nr:hypothetical protein TorRG33x02_136860 [Trema orientale]PON90402.1 hypothetical protein TorRG33x02_136870 [Trema orientale]
MASKPGFFLALLLVATAATVAKSCIIDGLVPQIVDGLQFSGLLSFPGLPATCVARVPVQVLNVLDGTVLCTGVTDELGNFNLLAQPAANFHFVPSNYVVSTITPITGCSGFTHGGLLQAPLTGVFTLISNLISGLLGLLGLVASFPCGAFA